MGELERVDEEEQTSPKAFTSFPEALSYIRRVQSEEDNSLCIVSNETGQFEVVSFGHGLILINQAGYRLLFAY